MSTVIRILLRQRIHKKTVVSGGMEETVITEDTQVIQDCHSPEELRDTVQQIIGKFVVSGNTDLEETDNERNVNVEGLGDEMMADL